MGKLLFHKGIFLLVLIFSARVHAQISPGPLTSAHSDLEGIDHCTKCHTVGKTLSNDNCLNCHKEIRSRMDAKKGYHSSAVGKQCAECHKEHHGKNFEIVHFDKKSFDHASVGFVLEGKHATTECEKCHTKDKFAEKDIQKLSDAAKAKTYLGLSQDCISCHTDIHKGQFSPQCTHCHNLDAWKPAVKFSHDRSKFPLTGSHKKVECYTCHKHKLADGKTVQFTKMDFSTCLSCHTDPHKGKFHQVCTQCHTTDSWHQVKVSQFNHAATQFPLKGKHSELRCELCHAKDPKSKNASGELGYHITKFQRCTNCHADAHAKQFEARKDGGGCESCHTENGFIPSTFSLIDHQQSRFPLTGSHGAIPCAKCHESGKVNAKSTRNFIWEKNLTCQTCHKDVHEGQFAALMMNGCETCHSTDSWQRLNFSHDRTKFPLKGKHTSVACSKCHTSRPGSGAVRYTGVSTVCSDCHTDNHAAQFAFNGITKCEPCHTENGWKLLLFNHNVQSKFVLSGKHTNVACVKCHREELINKVRSIRYKPLGTACIDCHPAQ